MRKEPTISGLDSSPGKNDSPDIDAAAVLSDSGGMGREGGRASRGSASRTNASRRQPPPPVQKVSSSSPMAAIAMIIALVAASAAGFLGWQNMQLMEQLADSDTRLKALEEQLTLSGDEASTSIDAVRAKLKWADSEIRKLWGVSHDKNRKKIASNEKKVKQLSSSISSQKKALAKAEKQLAEQKKILDKASGSLATLKKNINDLAAIRMQNQENADDLNSLSNKISVLERGLGERIRENEESIEAIDAYRISHNREFLRLKQQVQGQ
ncbi:MAG: hypothetical protein K6L73_05700 [Cellvibrionaceae bacterium]